MVEYIWASESDVYSTCSTLCSKLLQEFRKESCQLQNNHLSGTAYVKNGGEELIHSTMSSVKLLFFLYFCIFNNLLDIIKHDNNCLY